MRHSAFPAGHSGSDGSDYCGGEAPSPPRSKSQQHRYPSSPLSVAARRRRLRARAILPAAGEIGWVDGLFHARQFGPVPRRSLVRILFCPPFSYQSALLRQKFAAAGSKCLRGTKRPSPATYLLSPSRLLPALLHRTASPSVPVHYELLEGWRIHEHQYRYAQREWVCSPPSFLLFGAMQIPQRCSGGRHAPRPARAHRMEGGKGKAHPRSKFLAPDRSNCPHLLKNGRTSPTYPPPPLVWPFLIPINCTESLSFGSLPFLFSSLDLGSPCVSTWRRPYL